ncbi:hypothetical protein TPY_1647 [Sulfobacillus acidophilus TPY]|nr:hypothetical protein TPY_1647 [Sulfobacillus acidophilus TPY]
MLWTVHHMSHHGILFWWTAGGLVLTLEAVRSLWKSRRGISAWSKSLDAGLALLSLWLTGGSLAAGMSGYLAGFLLPWAIPGQGITRLIEPLEPILLGAVGLRSLAVVVFGPVYEHGPLTLWMIPWLLAGEAIRLYAADEAIPAK